MVQNRNLLGLYYTKIVKSLRYLEYSYQRTLKMPTNPLQMTDGELEAWDGFSARFARSSDIFLSKYIRAYLISDDPAFDGSFVDQLNRAHKLNLIDSVEIWMDIRRLRNASVHEYSDQDFEKIFLKFRTYTPLLLELPTRLPNNSNAIK